MCSDGECLVTVVRGGKVWQYNHPRMKDLCNICLVFPSAAETWWFSRKPSVRREPQSDTGAELWQLALGHFCTQCYLFPPGLPGVLLCLVKFQRGTSLHSSSKPPCTKGVVVALSQGAVLYMLDNTMFAWILGIDEFLCFPYKNKWANEFGNLLPTLSLEQCSCQNPALLPARIWRWLNLLCSDLNNLARVDW